MQSLKIKSALICVIGGLLPSAAFAKDHTNVLLIMADDMGYECVQANGGETYDTPRLDDLAATGMRFEHCHSQPICTPSRVQIMTGIYNNTNYVKFGILDPKARTFGHLFKDNGYKTVIAGKWQLEGGFEGPNNFGFDEYCLWQLTRRPPRFPNPGFEINGKQVDFTGGKYGPDIASDYLCEFIEKNKDEPWFAYYPMIPPHYPFQPTPDSEEWDPTESREYPKSEWRDEWFADMVTYTDKMVGKLVDKLAELGLRENTLIIFTGDNGTYKGFESQFKGETYLGGKGTTKDNGTHVPLIVNWPGTTPAGVVSQSLVDFSDMLPTIAEAAGIEVPANWGTDGYSFLSEIEGGKPSPRKHIYCWYSRDGVRDKASQHTRNQRYKLYADGKFYDIVEDFEEQNPIDTKSLPEELKDVYAQLNKPLKKRTAQTKKADPVQNEKRDQYSRESKENNKKAKEAKKKK
ncbi:MAG: sulfatase-like hydrolase/transferase [Verrucomicrobiota bacterium]